MNPVFTDPIASQLGNWAADITIGSILLRLLLSLGGLDAPTLEAAMNESRALRFTEATALLLEQRRGQAGAGRRKKFEL
jgi:hypothetical protein